MLNPVLVGPTKDQRSADTKPICFGGTLYGDEVDQGGTVEDSGCISVPTDDARGLALSLGEFSQTWFATGSQ